MCPGCHFLSPELILYQLCAHDFQKGNHCQLRKKGKFDFSRQPEAKASCLLQPWPIQHGALRWRSFQRAKDAQNVPRRIIAIPLTYSFMCSQILLLAQSLSFRGCLLSHDWQKFMGTGAKSTCSALGGHPTGIPGWGHFTNQSVGFKFTLQIWKRLHPHSYPWIMFHLHLTFEPLILGPTGDPQCLTCFHLFLLHLWIHWNCVMPFHAPFFLASC